MCALRRDLKQFKLLAGAILMLTWFGRGEWYHSSYHQQEQVEQVEDPHG